MSIGYPIETMSPRLWAKLRPEARRMRREPTEAERLLWGALRGRKLGSRFRRQHAIDRFIVDFLCFPEPLVVEVDGASHIGQEHLDEKRDDRLRSAGFSVVRFKNDDVLRHLDDVTADIQRRLLVLRIAAAPSSPSPDGEGAGG